MSSADNMFRMMSDQKLVEAIQKLEQVVAAAALTNTSSGWKSSYRDALDQARAELERRRT